MRYGHFDEAACEYVIDRPDLPASWINYLGTQRWCTVISQNAGGYAFYRSSEHGRVTRFRANAVPKDRPGRYVYVRDDDTGRFWSCSWQPVGTPLEQGRWRARHGLSYSVFESHVADIEASQTVFVPLDDDLEIWDVVVTNTGARPRRLSLFGYCEFSFHDVRLDNENFQMSAYASGASFADGIIEQDVHYEPGVYHFFTSTATPDGFDALRDAFVGTWHTETDPAAVVRGACTGSQGTTGNLCGALQHRIALAPGQSVRLAYLLGYGRRSAGAVARDAYARPAARDAALDRLRQHWAAKRDLFVPHTPSRDFDTLIGTWTPYQANTCVTWSRFASFVEVGGRTGLGFRDTAQDVMSCVHLDPEATRHRLLQLLRGQMSQGYGLHLFDPDAAASRPSTATVVPGRAAQALHGLADVCSDDHLWLVGAVCDWVAETGQLSFLDEIVGFADSDADAATRAAVLGPQAAAQFDPAPASVFAHLLRAVQFTADHVGAHGIAQGLRADWNDCLNLGGGESALVSFLHVWDIRALIGLTRALMADGRDLAALLSHLEAMATAAADACERVLWDTTDADATQGWYLRGFTADGLAIGPASGVRPQIFLEHMAWATIAGVASPQRARASLDAVHDRLASPWGLHLVQPCFTQPDDRIGFVTRVYPGVKENGAIFSHPNAWPIIAETMLGRGDRAFEYWDALQPCRQNDLADIRRAEPYVYAQFVYGRDHALFGRAENPWLTGSAGWMYTAATRYILGVRPAFDHLVVDPCIPSGWDGFRVERTWRGRRFSIEVRNPDGVCAGVVQAIVDGRATAPVRDETTGRTITVLPADGRDHHIVITLG